jgi:hypothetical protein
MGRVDPLPPGRCVCVFAANIYNVPGKKIFQTSQYISQVLASSSDQEHLRQVTQEFRLSLPRWTPWRQGGADQRPPKTVCHARRLIASDLSTALMRSFFLGLLPNLLNAITPPIGTPVAPPPLPPPPRALALALAPIGDSLVVTVKDWVGQRYDPQVWVRDWVGIYSAETAAAWNDVYPGTDSIDWQYVALDNDVVLPIDTIAMYLTFDRVFSLPAGEYMAQLLADDEWVLLARAAFSVRVDLDSGMKIVDVPPSPPPSNVTVQVSGRNRRRQRPDVIDPGSDEDPGGLIAGAIVGCIALLAALGAGGLYCYKKKTPPPRPANIDVAVAPPSSNKDKALGVPSAVPQPAVAAPSKDNSLTARSACVVRP